MVRSVAWRTIARGMMALSLAACAMAGVAAERVDGWRPFIVGGLTRGGDVIDRSIVVDDSGNPLRSQRLYAGNLIQLGVGAMWTSRELPLSLAFSANYHIDDITGRTESSMFIRYPVEAIAYYLSGDREWRAGIGLRYVVKPRIKANYPEEEPDAVKYTVRMENAKGVLVETGWAFGPDVWVNLRAVKELYKFRSIVENGVYTDLSSLQKANGSHVGVNLLYAF